MFSFGKTLSTVVLIRRFFYPLINLSSHANEYFIRKCIWLRKVRIPLINTVRGATNFHVISSLSNLGQDHQTSKMKVKWTKLGMVVFLLISLVMTGCFIWQYRMPKLKIGKSQKRISHPMCGSTSTDSRAILELWVCSNGGLLRCSHFAQADKNT